VVDNRGRLVGMITRHDLMEQHFHNLMAVGGERRDHGGRVWMVTEDREGVAV